MTVLDADWDNMGGGVLRRSDRNTPGLAEGDTIVHPLKGPLPGDADHTPGVYVRSRWTNKTVAAFPSGLGAEVGDITANTLSAAFAATPV